MIKDIGDGWYVYCDEDGNEKLRFQPPVDGMDSVDVLRFCKHLRKLVRDRQHGDN